MINNLYFFQNERSMLLQFCMFWFALTKTRNACIYIHIYTSLYMYTYRYVKYIYLRCMPAVVSLLNVISERARLIKNVVPPPLPLPPFFPIGPLCPFITSKQPVSLSLSLCSTPANRPLFPYSLRHSSSPPSLSPLPVPASLCLHQTAQCEDGAEETQ